MWLAFALWLGGIGMLGVLGSMKAAGWHGAGNTSVSGLFALLISFFAFQTMGALVAAHAPRNPLGWIFLAIGLVPLVNGAAENYTYQGLVHDPGSLPGAVAVAWWYSWSWYPTLILIAVVPLLYPTGRVPSRRWRPLLWLLLGSGSLLTLSFMFYPGPLDGDKKLPDNPVGIGFLESSRSSITHIVGAGTVLALVGVFVSVVVRFRRSRGDERQQMKLMTFAVVILVLALVLPGALGLGGNDVLFSLAVVQLPVAVGIALFKYRLYDVDRLINRTITYALVTLGLVGVFLGLVVLTTRVLPFSSPVGVAASTLAAAALFNPLRKRLQHLVDQRFNRARYDADSTLTAFSGRLRETVQIGAIESELLHAVNLSLAPRHSSVWVRPPT
jgi:hypothetical protein